MNAEPYPEVHWPPGWGPDRCDSFVSHERRVAAPASALFAHLAAVEEWPKWQQGVDRVEAYDHITVGSRFVVVTVPHTLDGIVGEMVPPNRFGWVAVSDGLSFYQSWLLLDEPDGLHTRTIFQEAASGPSALMRAADRGLLTRSWVDALPPADPN
jgi:hypothetical protein